MILFRPTGLSELKLVASLGWTAWPPRLPDQPIFYPVLSFEYARRIARDWNAKDQFSGFVGFVTTFQLEHEFSKKHPVRLAGGRSHEELWIPAADLDEFNRHIIGSITVLEVHAGPSFSGVIDPLTKVPEELAPSYRARPRTAESCVVRPASTHDAESTAALLVASITALCVDDHLNDTETLARWLGNKTQIHFEQWLADPENFIVVGELGSDICGVGLLQSTGSIRLCYVRPGMQGHGVGRALLHRLEEEAARRGISELRLMSTGSARQFYERLGFVPGGEARIEFGVLKGFPYKKELGNFER